MQKELVVKVLKNAGKVIAAGLGVTAIVKYVKLKKEIKETRNLVCQANMAVDLNVAMMELVMEENDALHDEIESLRNPEPQTKKK